MPHARLRKRNLVIILLVIITKGILREHRVQWAERSNYTKVLLERVHGKVWKRGPGKRLRPEFGHFDVYSTN